MSAPQVAEYREFVVRARTGGGYGVHVHPHLTYLFKVRDGHQPSDQPGWLSDVRFPDFDAAVAFGERLAPHIRAAADAHGVMTSEVGKAIRLISEQR